MKINLNDLPLSITRASLAALVLCLSLLAQSREGEWLRVFTDEESYIEVDRLSLVLEGDGIMRAEFRTKLLRQ